MNRRTFIKKLFASSLAILGIGGGTYYYAREIEPSMLTIHQETITSSKLSKSFNQFKIVHISDTHIGFHYSLEQFEQLIKKVNDLKPDCVVFTGDLVDKPNRYSWDSRLVNLLSSLSAPFGKFWIYGNHDHGGYGTDIVKEAMDNSGFILLKNSHHIIERNGDTFTLAGLDDAMLGDPDIESALHNTNTDKFTMLLVHEPDYAEITKNHSVDVQLSGHSHGGQVQIPFWGYVYTPTYAEKYVEGKYEIGSNPLHLFVSRGIGTTRLPYRFLCKPEITIFTLEHH